METHDLFGNFKYCEVCRKPLPLSYEENVCPFCKEQLLFRNVKEYIRSHDVNEYDVADHFNIPLQKVKSWIREGRIQYKDERLNAKQIIGHCQQCGAQITFGTLCTKCMKLKNISIKSASATRDSAGNMRHLADFTKF